MGSTSPPKRVLLLTNSEHGQANIYLATAYALLTLDRDVEVHFASFPPIAKSVASTSQHALSHTPHARPIIFHPLSGIAMSTAWSRPEYLAEKDGSRHAQGLRTAWAKMQILLRVTLPWTGPEFLEILSSITSVIIAVNPHICAVDPAFSPALTAVRHQRAAYLILAPNTIKDFAMPHQPWAEALWKYPCVGSAFPFPIPPRYIPLNVLLVLLTIIAGLFDSHRRQLQAYLHQHAAGATLTTLNDVSLGPPAKGVKFLVANRLALEFPLKVLPPHIIPCGPIIRPARPVAEADPELATWLARGPTVYVNLGTHVLMTEESAVEMATAIRILLDHARGVVWREKKMEGLQVLWKLAMDGEGEGKEGRVTERVGRILGWDVENGAVRIVRWIEAEPTAVLGSREVVCAVHHGGANSFLETASAGIPQVVLPVWMDTFDFARRAELLGIGRWGNKVTHKGQWGGELGNVLIDVLFGPEAARMKERAQELAKLCHRDGAGRVIAAKMILKEIREPVLNEKEDDLLSLSSGTGL